MYITSLDITLTFSINNLELIQPSQKERCKVINGVLYMVMIMFTFVCVYRNDYIYGYGFWFRVLTWL